MDKATNGHNEATNNGNDKQRIMDMTRWDGKATNGPINYTMSQVGSDMITQETKVRDKMRRITKNYLLFVASIAFFFAASDLTIAWRSREMD